MLVAPCGAEFLHIEQGAWLFLSDVVPFEGIRHGIEELLRSVHWVDDQAVATSGITHHGSIVTAPLRNAHGLRRSLSGEKRQKAALAHAWQGWSSQKCQHRRGD